MRCIAVNVVSGRVVVPVERLEALADDALGTADLRISGRCAEAENEVGAPFDRLQKCWNMQKERVWRLGEE